MSFESYLSPNIPPVESCSTDDDSDDSLQSFSHSNNTENDITTWHCQLAKTLLSMHNDMHGIITKFDEMSNGNIRDTFQYKRIKFELMSIALMLNPSDLPTCNIHDSTFPYADVKILDDFVDDQHDKLRLRIHRILSKLKRGMEKVRLILFSSLPINQSASYLRNYRRRLANSLSDIREHMIEYNRVNQCLQDHEVIKHQKTIHQMIIEMKIKNACIEERLIDYKTKLHTCNKNHEFIATPFVLLPAESEKKMLKLKTKSEDSTPSPQPLDFPDLHHQANEFFNTSNII